jgi:hypothetical protein
MEEVIAGMYIALDQKYIDQKNFDKTYQESHTVGLKINALIKYLQNH